MATVELLADKALRRKTAMKVLLPEMATEDQAVKSFIREAQVTGQLDHPNIVPVYDLGSTPDEQLFFTMKLLAGKTLSEVVEALPEGPPDRESLFDLLEIVLKMCDALAFAHQRSVVHRDIKPENIMIGDFGQVYLVDWGLAKLTQKPGSGAGDEVEPVSSTFQGIWGRRVIGTPVYMSPEQAAGGEIDERADVFAVGAVLYFLLARRPPYEGGSAEEVVFKARLGEFTPLKDAMAPLSPPRGLDRIVSKAMATEPEDRYQKILELRQDVVSFMRGGSLPQVRFPEGEYIVREGDAGDYAYIIVSGNCEVSKTDASGEQTVIRTIGPGECFGETAIMTAAPRTASVIALEATTVERVTREELLEELDSMKPWVSVFLRSLADRFRERETRS